MIIQIEYVIDCLRHLFPDSEYVFELDHSSGHNMERPDGLSTTPIFYPDVLKYDIVKEGYHVTRNLTKIEIKIN